jgi:LPS O-antigen subunit length determinant protein (WzzB/FepE family)
MEAFLLAQGDMMRQILQNQQQMNQRHNDQLEEDPRVATYALFHKAEEPLEADAWLRAIEAKLDVLTSPCS